MCIKRLTVPALLALALGSGSARADVIPFLGSAQQFAVFGGQAVTNAGATTVHGDLGTAPGSAITGRESISFAAGGTLHQTDAAATSAQSDASAAYARLAALGGGTDLSGQDLGSLGVLTAGIYRFATSAALTGTLTLDFANDPTGVFIFLIGSTLSTAADSVVNVLNGTASNGIYFQVGQSATLGADTVFAGNILADQSVSFGAGASIACGRAFGLGAAVTMIGNTVSDDCTAYAPAVGLGDYGSAGFSGFGQVAAASGDVPEPATPALFVLGFGAAALLRRRGRR